MPLICPLSPLEPDWNIAERLPRDDRENTERQIFENQRPMGAYNITT